MLTTKLSDTNYRAKIVALPAVRPHPNADRLNLTTVDFQTVIVSKDAVPDTLYVYFPLECQINSEFLSFTNNFSDAELNADKAKKGFFDKRGRVRATRLRQILSEGYMHPVESVNEWLKRKDIRYEITEKDIGVEFDSFGDTIFVRKYVIKTKQVCNNSKSGKAAKESRIIQNQFRFHIDTPQLKKVLTKINPNDTVSISYKIHGTSGIFSNILCKRKLSLIEKLSKFLGSKIVEGEYSYVYSSRWVIKSEQADKKAASYYDQDIWAIVHEELKDKIKPGISLYVEIAGQIPNGKWIQKPFDYGTKEGRHAVWVYRITYTAPNGDVFEFSTPQIQSYCEKFGLQMVPVFYCGLASKLYDIPLNNHWHENLLEKLSQDYLEKDCKMCRNKVPAEGIVFRKENSVEFEVAKLKSNAFYEFESKKLDRGEENIEDES